MQLQFYFRLTLLGMKKNKQYYLPYILTGILMCSVSYIMRYLNTCPNIDAMKGATILKMLFGFGFIIMILFSMIFLFYTNSFLIKKRDRELGLYTILGMNKKNIIKIIVCETVVISFLVITVGCLSGIVFSKLMELILVKLIGESVTFSFYVNATDVLITSILFLGIYFILLIYSVIKVSIQNGLQLLHSHSYGEKEPKANWLLTLVGVVLLLIAYYLAITITSPLKALSTFFAAVVMVIVATYLLFITGSVALCKILQKNKKYYYTPNHFVSVSSMRYRMKKNGAGLASICILITIVLVLSSVTISAYIGIKDAVNKAFPKEGIGYVSTRKSNVNIEELIEESLTKVLPDSKDLNIYEEVEMNYGSFTSEGYKDGTYSMEVLHVISLDTYNRLQNQHRTLEEGQCLLLSNKEESYATFTLNDNEALQVKEVLQEQVIAEGPNVTSHSITLVVKDLNALSYPENVDETWRFETDTKVNEEELVPVLSETLAKYRDDLEGYSYSFTTKTDAEESYYSLFGGIIALSSMLSITFLAVAVMIIYYKQLIEGLEDANRYSVLCKVGMDDSQIRKTIHSQIVTVFFAPLLFAGVHMLCAYPMITKLLVLFAIKNTQLISLVVLGVYCVIAIFYIIVYKLTSRTYYKIIRA